MRAYERPDHLALMRIRLDEDEDEEQRAGERLAWARGGCQETDRQTASQAGGRDAKEEERENIFSFGREDERASERAREKNTNKLLWFKLSCIHEIQSTSFQSLYNCN